MKFIGIDTYYDNGDTGITWFLNDIGFEHDEFLKFLLLITSNDTKEITIDINDNFTIIDSKERNSQIHFDTYGCFVWGNTGPGYPSDEETSLDDPDKYESMKKASVFIRELLKSI